MDKLIEMLGKILKPLLSSKTLWTIIVAVAILSVAILVLSQSQGGGLTRFFGLGIFAPCDNSGAWECPRTWVGLAALVTFGLILARVLLWVIGRVRDQYFT